MGQEKHNSLTKSYFRDADAIIFVFELNNRKSFESLKKDWI